VENGERGSDREAYEAPAVRELGTIDELTLGDDDSITVTKTTDL
jgi:hypothetical protein